MIKIYPYGEVPPEGILSRREELPDVSGPVAEIIAAVPGVYAFVGSGSDAVPGSRLAHHTPGFDIDERCLPIAAGLYVESALSWLK